MPWATQVQSDGYLSTEKAVAESQQLSAQIREEVLGGDCEVRLRDLMIQVNATFSAQKEFEQKFHYRESNTGRSPLMEGGLTRRNLSIRSQMTATKNIRETP